MTNYGFFKVAAAVPSVKVADCFYNVLQIKDLINKAAEQGVEIIVFPELSVTAYTCMDLFSQSFLLQNGEKALAQLIKETENLNITAIVGMPITIENRLINAAVVFQAGEIHGIVPKSYIPNYKEFQELRWFTSALDLTSHTARLCGKQVPVGNHLLFTKQTGADQVSFAVEICEDLWVPVPPSSKQAINGAEIIFNLSASNELIGKNRYLQSLIKQQSARCISGYVYASAGFGESSTDLVFAGNGIIAENGKIIAISPRFTMQQQLIIGEIDIESIRHDRMVSNSFTQGNGKMSTEGNPVQTVELPKNKASEKRTHSPFILSRHIEAHPFVPQGEALHERCEEIFSIQVEGLAKRLVHTNCQTAVIGISGGLDSTLALLVTVQTFDALKLSRKGIVAVTMPGFGTTDRTYHNALDLIKSLGVTLREISIEKACLQHFKDIEHNPTLHNVVYENVQARERTQILMDIANQKNGLVIGTGDLSELALGWATYNGDHMSMYAVNCSIPKTLVKSLVQWVANNKTDKKSKATLLDIADTPISPELIPADKKGNILQKTEDLVGPYELHDFYLYHFIRFGSSPAKIYYLARIAFKEVYNPATIKKWLQIFFRRFFNQQFKRNCLPDGPKVGSITLSPRGDWRFPSDATSAMWLDEIEKL